MSTVNPKFLTDGATVLLGGVDEGREPLLLRQDQVHRAINTTFRGGFARSRPAFDKKGLNFESGEVGMWFYFHFMQGAEIYKDAVGSNKKICSVGGRIFQIDPAMDFMVTDITPRKFTTTTALSNVGSSNSLLPVAVADASTIFAGYPIYINGMEYLVASKAGSVLSVYPLETAIGTNIASGSTVEYLDPNSPDLPLAWFQQAEQYMVIQDDQSSPIIFDGSKTRRAVRGDEIPTGSMMAYGQGRIWIAINNGRDYVAGDIVGGPTGVLGFKENVFLSGGGAFHIPSNAGRIRAMKFVMNLDTSLGQGPMQVLCDNGVFSCNAPTSRELWQVMRDPIQTVSLINFGATGQAGTVLVNGDLFFRAKDGIRSFIIARRDFGMWGNTSISREVSTILDRDTPTLLPHASGVLFDNRILMTCAPQPSLNGVRHLGIIALDFDLITTMREKAPPAYDGFWTGIQPTVLLAGTFAGVERCFVFALGPTLAMPDSPPPELNEPRFYSGQNQLFEIIKGGEDYQKLDNGCRRMACALEHKAFSFPKANFASGLKRLEAAELWISEFHQQVDFTLQYKPDQNPCWQPWASKTICVTSDQCAETDACASVASASNMLGFKTRLSFGKPDDANNLADEKAMPVGYSFQSRLSWSGYAELNRFMLYAHEIEEWAINPPSDDRSVCSTIQCCPPDPFEYRAIYGRPDAPLMLPDYLGTGTAAFYWFTDAEATTTLFIRDSVGTTDRDQLNETPGFQKYNLEDPPNSFTLSAWVDIDQDASGDCGPKESPMSSATLNL